MRLVARQHLIDRLARCAQCGIAERAFREHRRVARGLQQDIPVTQRHLELLGQVQHHLAARLRAAGFQKAEMSRGDFRFERQLELTHAATLAPFAQQVADRSHGD